jgi:hypothetical protein
VIVRDSNVMAQVLHDAWVTAPPTIYSQDLWQRLADAVCKWEEGQPMVVSKVADANAFRAVLSEVPDPDLARNMLREVYAVLNIVVAT